MAKKKRKFADDGWAVWVDGDDTSTVYINVRNWKLNCHMTQQSHCWAYTPKKPELKEIHVPQSSSQYCLS